MTENIIGRYPEERGCDDDYRCSYSDHPRSLKSDGTPDPDYCSLPTDNGTMSENVQGLRDAVVGRRIVKAEQRDLTEAERAAIHERYWYGERGGLILELDNGTQVVLRDDGDCCAYTSLESFFYDPAGVDHMILGVGTEDGFDTWHIYADFGDVLKLDVGWSCGNPFYYGYGFDIKVIPLTLEGEVIEDRLALEP